MQAIEAEDLTKFEHIKKCRNTLTHEMFAFASSGVDFDVAEAFNESTLQNAIFRSPAIHRSSLIHPITPELTAK